MPAPDSRGRARRRPLAAAAAHRPATPSRRRARKGRGGLARPVNLALLRGTALLLLVPLFLIMVSIGRPGPYPAPALPPAFDQASATTLATELARYYPDRVPGSSGATGAADWVREKLALYGLDTSDDAWTQSIPGLGRVTLHNLVTVVPGASRDAIVVLAHRDNVGVGPGANDNASGTAALIELVRGYGRLGTGASRPRPMHTLIFLSSDGGAFGGYGAAHFAAASPYRDSIKAVLALDGLAGRAAPRLEIAGYLPHSPTPALVRTADVRVSDQDGSAPARAGWLAQLVDLGLPYGYGEQGPFLARGISALRLATAPDTATSEASADTSAHFDVARFGRLGRAADTIVASLDGGVELTGGTGANLYLGSRVIRGWAVELLLLTALVPFLAVTIDLVARCRRRRLPLLAAWRALRIRLGVWLWIAALVGIGALAGVFPTDAPVTPPPDSPDVTSWPVAWSLVLAALAALVWWRVRRVLVPAVPATDEEVLAGYALTLAALGAVAVATAVVSPYGLVFVLPSLYAWLWLPELDRRSGWGRDALYGLGFAGPALALVAVGTQLGLGLHTPLYLVTLMTLGFVPWTTVLVLVAWAAVATQLGALAGGRYRPVPRRGRPRRGNKVRTL